MTEHAQIDHLTQVRITETIRLLDADNDGHISFLEFLYVLTALQDFLGNITEQDVKQVVGEKPQYIKNETASQYVAALYRNKMEEAIDFQTDTEDLTSNVDQVDLDAVAQEVFGEKKKKSFISASSDSDVLCSLIENKQKRKENDERRHDHQEQNHHV
jgi:L-lactate utilization protein LutC